MKGIDRYEKKQIKLLITVSGIGIVLLSLLSCSGDVKGSDSSVDVTGMWKGEYKSSVYVMSGDWTATISQNKTTLSGTIDIPDIGLNNADLQGSVVEMQSLSVTSVD